MYYIIFIKYSDLVCEVDVHLILCVNYFNLTDGSFQQRNPSQ